MKIFSATKYNLKQITPKNPVRVTQKLFGDHGSGHDSHHPVENFFRERNVKKPWSTWDHVKSDQFSVDSMISKLREPVVKSDLSKSLLQSDQSVTKEELNNQYIDFLTKSFTNIISKRYPDYRSNYEEYKHLLPNMDKMNSYQREVEILDAYMQWSINSLRDKIDQASQPSGESALEQAKSRLEIFRNLIKEDSSDTSIMKNLRKKLKKILDSDVRYEEFKNLVTKNNENQELLESAVLQRISNSKGEGYSKLIPLQGQQTDLNNVNSSLNPNRRNIFSALYHDQVKLNTLAKNPDQIEQERTKYLAFYDLILDQHIRQVQGKLQKDDPFRYVKKEHRPREVYEDEDAKNMYWDYKMSLNNEFYKNFKLEMNKFIKSSRDKNVQATEDPVNSHNFSTDL